MELNLSPAIFEAKCNLEEFRGINFIDVVDEDGKYVTLADPEADGNEVLATFDALFDKYVALAKVAAFENNTPVDEVMRYMDKWFDAYASCEGSEPEYEAIYRSSTESSTMSTWEGQRYGRCY